MPDTDLLPREERRVFERFPARFPVKFKDTRHDYGRDVVLRDASAQGMRILTKERFFNGDAIALDVELPDGGGPMALSGRVVWARFLNLSFWETGVRFDRVDLLKMKRLFKLADETPQP